MGKECKYNPGVQISEAYGFVLDTEQNPAPGAQAPVLDSDGFPIEKVERIKALGGLRVDCQSGVYYRLPMRSLFPDNPNISEQEMMRLYPTDKAAQKAMFQYWGELSDLVHSLESSYKS